MGAGRGSGKGLRDRGIGKGAQMEGSGGIAENVGWTFEGRRFVCLGGCGFVKFLKEVV